MKKVCDVIRVNSSWFCGSHLVVNRGVYGFPSAMISGLVFKSYSAFLKLGSSINDLNLLSFLNFHCRLWFKPQSLLCNIYVAWQSSFRVWLRIWHVFHLEEMELIPGFRLYNGTLTSKETFCIYRDQNLMQENKCH